MRPRSHSGARALVPKGNSKHMTFGVSASDSQSVQQQAWSAQAVQFCVDTVPNLVLIRPSEA